MRERRKTAICFSVLIEKDLNKLAREFNASPSLTDFQKLKDLQTWAESAPSEEVKKTLGLSRKPSSNPFKTPDESGRVYPNYFAPVIVFEKGQRIIKPMRYRVRPAFSQEEIPSKYNVFNARLDALETRRTWKSLFLKNHGLFPFKSFFEWVERDGKKKLIHFFPDHRQSMWAPALFDHWQSRDGKVAFDSFAIITGDPPDEVEAQGHDRCPIFLEQKQIDLWLNPQHLDQTKAHQLLNQQEPVHYGHGY